VLQAPDDAGPAPSLETSLLRRFMVGSSDSDSDEDKRVVRSAKDKRFEELQATCDEIRVRARARSPLSWSTPLPMRPHWSVHDRCKALSTSVQRAVRQ